MGIVEDVRSDIVALVRSLPDAALLELARVALGSAPPRRYRCSSCGEAGHRASTCVRAARPETAALPQVAAPDVPAITVEAVAAAETAPAEAPAPPAVPADEDDDEEQEQPEESETDADNDDVDDVDDEPSSGARLLGPARKREPDVDLEDAAPEPAPSPTSPGLSPEVARLEEVLTARARAERVGGVEPEDAALDVEPEILRNRRRSRRARTVRALSLNMKRMTKRDILAERALYPEAGRRQLPMFRYECESGPRPCPYVSCKHHLFLDVSESTGAIKLNFPDLQDEDGPRLDEMLATCALDVAELGGVTLEIAGDVLNITRERLRQIEVDTMTRLARRPALRQLRESA